MQKLTILGATGSIGDSTLKCVREHPDAFEVTAISGYHNIDRLIAIAKEFKPKVIVCPAQHHAAVAKACGSDIEYLTGTQGLKTIATLAEVDKVVAAIVGAAGLASTYAAINAGKDVLLANKETLVMAGGLLMQRARQTGSKILPIDSEHMGLFQCLADPFAPLVQQGVSQLWLTASGGPFRTLAPEALAQVTPAQAANHPTWNMGQKISVDSATLMNKGFEVIEAHWLFDMPVDKIKVILHPQSQVHALVEYCDGSFLAHCGNPDMRIPISYALNYPKRLALNNPPFNLLTQGGQLEFAPVDTQQFPALALAYQAIATGGLAPTILNAANEMAVNAFMQQHIAFTDIVPLCQQALDTYIAENIADPSLEQIDAIDQKVRMLWSAKLVVAS